jgi:hypothetical protein
MTFEYESRRVEDMRNQLIRLHSARVNPKVYYDAQWAQFKGSPEGEHLEVKATEIAELTVQQHGSAYEGYQSISEDPIRKIVAYVGGINTSDDILVVGQNVEPETRNLTLPARLSLQDLIGYRTIEKVE